MKKTIIYLMLVFTAVAFTTAAKWAEKPVENLDTIAGKWKGSGITTTGSTLEVEYVFRKDGSLDGWAGGIGWSKKLQSPPGTLHINAGKLEYRNDKGTLRTGVLYEDKKGRRKIEFVGETGGTWDVRPTKK
jgi:hypothetical protein